MVIRLPSAFFNITEVSTSPSCLRMAIADLIILLIFIVFCGWCYCDSAGGFSNVKGYSFVCAPYWAWRSSLMMHSCRFSTESFNSSSIRLARSKLCRPKSTVVLFKLTSMLIQLRLTILVFIFIICAPYWAVLISGYKREWRRLSFQHCASILDLSRILEPWRYSMRVPHTARQICCRCCVHHRLDGSSIPACRQLLSSFCHSYLFTFVVL